MEVVIYPSSGYNANSTLPYSSIKDWAIVADRMKQLYKNDRNTIRRSVFGVLVVVNNRHPHLLVIKLKKGFYKLPGGRLAPDEDDISGLQRKLINKLHPSDLGGEFQIGQSIGSWWRPNFTNILYPYLPAHVKYAKERTTVYIVQLPESATFNLPRNFSLEEIAFHDIYGQSQKYGAIISAIPSQVSKYLLPVYPDPKPEEPAAD